MTEKRKRAIWFKHFRDWQRKCAAEMLPARGGDSSFGGAWPGEHALAAWDAARSQIAFRERLSADVATSNRRSKAAKKGWKKRRAAVAA